MRHVFNAGTSNKNVFYFMDQTLFGLFNLASDFMYGVFPVVAKFNIEY